MRRVKWLKTKPIFATAFFDKTGGVCATPVCTLGDSYMSLQALFTPPCWACSIPLWRLSLCRCNHQQKCTQRETHTHRAFTIHIPTWRRKKPTSFLQGGMCPQTDSCCLLLVVKRSSSVHTRGNQCISCLRTYVPARTNTCARQTHPHTHNQSVWVMCWRQWAIPKRLLFSWRGEDWARSVMSPPVLFDLCSPTALLEKNNFTFCFCSRWLQREAKHF